jgi:hypothetical protein
MVISNELKVTALGEDRLFAIDRAIFEPEEQPGGDRPPPDDLDEGAFSYFRGHATVLPGAFHRTSGSKQNSLKGSKMYKMHTRCFAR